MRFFGHPIHPMTVHFPIVFYLLGVLLTVGYLWQGKEDYEKVAYWSFTVSWLAVIFSMIVGLIDQNQLSLNDPRRNAVNNHITAGVGLLIINGLLIYMRFRWANLLRSSRRFTYLGLMALGVVVLITTAWLGGELVYRLQIGIQ